MEEPIDTNTHKAVELFIANERTSRHKHLALPQVCSERSLRSRRRTARRPLRGPGPLRAGGKGKGGARAGGARAGEARAGGASASVRRSGVVIIQEFFILLGFLLLRLGFWFLVFRIFDEIDRCLDFLSGIKMDSRFRSMALGAA